MSNSLTLYTKQWIDDHLDLYNLAVELGDTAWQEELKTALDDHRQRVAQELKQRKKDQLWRRYDSINELLIELYSELRSNEHKDHQQLMSKLMILKQQRLEISRQLATIG